MTFFFTGYCINESVQESRYYDQTAYQRYSSVALQRELQLDHQPVMWLSHDQLDLRSPSGGWEGKQRVCLNKTMAACNCPSFWDLWPIGGARRIIKWFEGDRMSIGMILSQLSSAGCEEILCYVNMECRTFQTIWRHCTCCTDVLFYVMSP